MCTYCNCRRAGLSGAVFCKPSLSSSPVVYLTSVSGRIPGSPCHRILFQVGCPSGAACKLVWRKAPPGATRPLGDAGSLYCGRGTNSSTTGQDRVSKQRCVTSASVCLFWSIVLYLTPLGSHRPSLCCERALEQQQPCARTTSATPVLAVRTCAPAQHCTNPPSRLSVHGPTAGELSAKATSLRAGSREVLACSYPCGAQVHARGGPCRNGQIALRDTALLKPPNHFAMRVKWLQL